MGDGSPIVTFATLMRAEYLMLYQANIYFFNVDNKNLRKRYEINSKLTIKTAEPRL